MVDNKADKVILTHRGNIEAKYGRKSSRILNALKRLKLASAKAGLKTEIIFLDDPQMMEPYQATPITNPDSQEQFKHSIDQLYNCCEPDYVVLAGAQDIIPFQMLKNPARRLDEEEFVPTDLPYASASEYSDDTKKYLSPTRVVGRIPDIPKSGDPGYFEKIISHIVHWKPVAASVYQSYFGLSTVSWKGSTSKNIARLFKKTDRLHFSPLDGPAYRKNILSARCHFINCHGALEDTAFYGEKGDSQPESLYSRSLDGRVQYGTLVAAECCYGAQLFDPQEAGDMSIANKYLREGAIGFLGSSNVAYGPADNLALADLMTQYFLLQVFEGASIGRALLEARIRFLNDAGPYLDVMELKTYTQFLLLGDPSIHPVMAVAGSVSSNAGANWMNTRNNRRENLKAKGHALQQSIIPPIHSEKIELPVEIQPEIRKMLKENKMTDQVTKEVFVSKTKPVSGSGKAKQAEVRYIAYSQKEQKGKIVKRKILMVKEKANKLLGSRLYLSR